MLQILFAMMAPVNASASVCIVSTGWQAVYCDGKKTTTLQSGDQYIAITAAISSLQDNGYKLSFITMQSEGKEYTLTK